MLPILIVNFVFSIGLQTAIAQTKIDYIEENLTRTSEGEMFTVSFKPKSRIFEVKLAGKAMAELGPDRVILIGREIGASGKPRELHIQPAGKAFELMDSLSPSSRIEVEVRDRGNQKAETHHLDAPVKH